MIRALRALWLEMSPFERLWWFGQTPFMAAITLIAIQYA